MYAAKHSAADNGVGEVLEAGFCGLYAVRATNLVLSSTAALNDQSQRRNATPGYCEAYRVP